MKRGSAAHAKQGYKHSTAWLTPFTNVMTSESIQ